jgi:hypothetical protein
MDHDQNNPPISLRNYFAAHAPEVPEWFLSSLPPQPNRLDLWTHFTSPDQQYWLKDFKPDEITQEKQWPADAKVPQSFKDEVTAYLAEIDKGFNDIHAWENQEKIRRIVEWRFYYADNMIAGSSK